MKISITIHHTTISIFCIPVIWTSRIWMRNPHIKANILERTYHNTSPLTSMDNLTKNFLFTLQHCNLAQKNLTFDYLARAKPWMFHQEITSTVLKLKELLCKLKLYKMSAIFVTIVFLRKLKAWKSKHKSKTIIPK